MPSIYEILITVFILYILVSAVWMGAVFGGLGIPIKLDFFSKNGFKVKIISIGAILFLIISIFGTVQLLFKVLNFDVIIPGNIDFSLSIFMGFYFVYIIIYVFIDYYKIYRENYQFKQKNIFWNNFFNFLKSNSYNKKRLMNEYSDKIKKYEEYKNKLDYYSEIDYLLYREFFDLMKKYYKNHLFD